MSLVLDAVNTFFGHQHNQPAPPQHPYQHTTAPHHFRQPPPQSANKSTSTPDRSDTPMSHNAAGAISSTTTTQSYPPQHEHGQQQSHQSQAAHLASHASSHSAEDASQLATPRLAQPADAARMDQAQALPKKIRVRDLEHIQQFATEDMDLFSETGSSHRLGSGARENATQYEISDMKVEHIIEMVAGLLTKITTTNDQQHEHLHRQPAYTEGASGIPPQTSSVLAFHGKNVPSITILSYLSRIHKYCPTSYEVFLSLLVYFDRMTERVNAGPMETLRQQQELDQLTSGDSASDPFTMNQTEEKAGATPHVQQATPPSSGNLEKGAQDGVPGTPYSKGRDYSPEHGDVGLSNAIDPLNLSHFFVVDSFNIHRLVIAGVTCASKFFSDIFYTNSRYAKVGGLPLSELNHLELQFLLLNDFRLSVPVEEIEAYGTMLVEFYAREVVAQRRAAQAMRTLSESSAGSTATVRAQ